MIDYRALFGTLAPGTESCPSAEVLRGGRTVCVSIEMESDSVDPATLTSLYDKTSDLDSLEKRARSALVAALNNGDASLSLYLDHHRKELGNLIASDAALVERLVLVNVTLYPEDPQESVWLDFSIAPQDTQYVILVAFTSELALSRIAMES
ncbi:MAG: DUF2004 domain-containing protein [Deltaproteobacteria bacterium]|jgi:hypothetical protein